MPTNKRARMSSMALETLAFDACHPPNQKPDNSPSACTWAVLGLENPYQGLPPEPSLPGTMLPTTHAPCCSRARKPLFIRDSQCLVCILPAHPQPLPLVALLSGSVIALQEEPSAASGPRSWRCSMSMMKVLWQFSWPCGHVEDGLNCFRCLRVTPRQARKVKNNKQCKVNSRGNTMARQPNARENRETVDRRKAVTSFPPSAEQEYNDTKVRTQGSPRIATYSISPCTVLLAAPTLGPSWTALPCPWHAPSACRPWCRRCSAD